MKALSQTRPWRSFFTLVPVIALSLLGVSNAHAQASRPSADEWKLAVTPYLWFPGLNATLRYGPPPATGASPNVEIDAGNVLGALDMALMLTAVAQKGRWSIGTDIVYADLGSNDSKVKSIDFNPGPGPINIANTTLDLGTQSKVKMTVWTLAGGYAIVQEPHFTFDVIGGFRYLHVDSTTNWLLTAAVTGPVGTQNFSRAGAVSASDTYWDGIVGVRGRFKLGEGNWFAPYYLDVGTGNSKLTWQAMAGVGYSFRWGDVMLAYRYLDYEQSGNNTLIKDMSMGGLVLGAQFRF